MNIQKKEEAKRSSNLEDDKTKTKEIENKYRHLLNNLGDAVFVHDMHGKILNVNDYACRRYGYSYKEFLTMQIKDIEIPDQEKYIQQRIQLLLKNGKVIFETIHKDSQKRHFPVEGTVKLGESDGKQIIIAISHDITQRKKIENALHESEKKYRNLVESTVDLVWSADIKGIHTFTNKSIEQHLGYNVEEITGSDSFQLIHPDDKDSTQKIFQESVDQKKGWSDFLIRWIHKDGSIRYFESSAQPTFDVDDNLTGFNGIDRDITDRKQAEDALQKAHDELERKMQKRTEELTIANKQLHKLSQYLQFVREQERTNVAREVHDDLGQILTAVKIDLSWLKGRLHKDQKKLIKKAGSTIDLVDGAIKSVKRIISNLRPGLLDDLGLVAAIEWLGQDFQDRTGIHVEVRISPSQFNLANDLSTAIFRICQESLTNVARHSQATEVKMTMIMKDSTIELNLIDNGIGVTEEQIYGHDSFGLIGIKERVGMFEGEVEIYGIPGKGTTITVSLRFKNRGLT